MSLAQQICHTLAVSGNATFSSLVTASAHCLFLELYIDGVALTNFNGDLYWDGSAVGGTNSGSFDVPYVYSGNNLAIGPSSLGSLSSGGRNTAFGEGALPDLTTGSENTAVGSGALGDLVSGGENLAFGADALRRMTTGDSNIAIGNDAGHETNGSNNIFIGNGAGYLETGSDKLYIKPSTTNLITGDFATGNFSLGQTWDSLNLNALTVAGTLTASGDAMSLTIYILVQLTNDNGTLTWGGSAVGSGSDFTGGTVANATTFNSAVTLADTLSVTGATTLSNTLSVTGAVTLSNALTVAGTLTASGDAYVVGQIYMDGVPLSNNNGVLQWNGVEVSSTTDSYFYT